MKKTLICYHADCPDGFTAAWAAWLKFKDSAEYFPINYIGPRPIYLDRDVFFLDFCPPSNELPQIMQESRGVVILDHHISSKDTILSIPNGVFNNNKSGAGIAWEYFHNTDVPKIVEHVQDRDLWIWKNPNSEFYCLNLDCNLMSFDNWNDIHTKSQEVNAYDQIISDGKIMAHQFKSIAETIASCAEKVRFLGVEGLIVNGPIRLNSLVGNILVNKTNTFGLIWRCDDGKNVIISLRGNGNTDVAKMAQQIGGGGHKNAAGAVVPVNDFFKMAQYIN